MTRHRTAVPPSADAIFVSNVLADGGAGRVLSLLANKFAEDGHRVHVLSFRPHTDEYLLSSNMGMSYGPASRIKLLEKARRVIWLRQMIKQKPEAVIIAFEYFVNMQVLIACIGLRNRVTVSERNDPATVGSGFRTDLLRKLLYRRAAMLVCQTEEASDYFSTRIKKTVILNPLNPDLPPPIESRRRLTVVTFCRLESQKNLGMLVRAFAEFREDHPDYTLEIYGDGSARASLVSLVESLSLTASVRILPARTDIHDVVRDCAMFVLSSDYEGLSNSMLEAMALGLPTICTDCPCGGARMVIDNGRNGLLIPVADTAALVAAMSQVADDPEFAHQISQAGLLLRNDLSVDRIASQWSKVVMEGISDAS